MRLIYERGGERIAFPLDEGETYIGRKDYCEIYFPDGSLSKRHARLVRSGGRLLVFDAGSRNGTVLNGRIVDQARLANGDLIQCGKLQFRVEGVPEGGEAAEDFEVLPHEDSAKLGVLSEVGRGRGGGGGGGGGGAPRGSRVLQARAVASTEARASMLDVLPEVPASGEVVAPRSASRSRVEPQAMARLRRVDGGGQESWDLTGETVTLGSKAENAVCLTGEGVSRYHAEVVLDEGVWLLKDLGARNGLFVAGERVDVYELKQGDEFQIGTCRLRFELVQTTPGAVLSELLARLMKDPAGAFREDARVRMGAAALVTAALLVLLSLGAGGAGVGISRTGGGAGVGGAWLIEGSAAMVDGDYREARDVFRRAKAHLPTFDQHLPRTLEDVAELWMTLERGPLVFRWERAGEALRETARLRDLPPELRAWLNEQVGFVDRNLTAYEVLTEVEALGAQANQQVAAKDFDGGLDTYARAISRLRGIDPASKLRERAAELATSFERTAFLALIEEVEQRSRAQNPDWVAALRLLARAAEFAQSAEQRGQIRRLSDRCERNRRDNILYTKAVEIVQRRDVARYPDAIAFLEQVDRLSRVYEDAQAYLEWIDADLKVRQAQRHYDIGDAQRAMQLLAQAMQHEVLGDEARRSVTTRRTAWLRVVRAYDRGQELLENGDSARAKEEFEQVLRFEPNEANRYHMRARAQLGYIAQIQEMDLQRSMKTGVEAIQRGDWAGALNWFAEVRKDPNHTPRDLDHIRTLVVEANRRHRLLDNAERDLLHDRTDRFVHIRPIFILLTVWLPADHPDKPKARKLLENVVERLKIWRRAQGAAAGGRR